jgi:hypothetical protein
VNPTSRREPSSDLRARVLAEIAKTPAQTRGEHRKRIFLIAAVGALATTTLFFAMGGFQKGTRPVELVLFTSGFGLIAAIVLTRVSSGVTGSMLGRPRQSLLLACVVAAPILAVVALTAAAMWPTNAAEEVPGQGHIGCAVATLAQGALPLIALIIPRRGTDPVHPAITGAALGMTAGAWTAMMAYLRCPHAQAFHCIAAHVIPTIVLTMLGALLGHALLKIKSNPKS